MRLIDRKKAPIGLFAALAMAAGGCASDRYGENETVGTLVGAGVGGYIGSEIGGRGTSGAVGAAAGTLAGAMLGNSIGRRLDEADRLEHQRTTQQALESAQTGTAQEWHNPDSGDSGSVTPTRTYETESGQPCREFQQTIIVGGEEVQGYGTACRQPDGAWKIVETR